MVFAGSGAKRGRFGGTVKTGRSLLGKINAEKEFRQTSEDRHE
jgi:hypothetical protein